MCLEAQALACINGNKTIIDFMKNLLSKDPWFAGKNLPIFDAMPRFSIMLHDGKLNEIIDAKEKEEQGLLFNQFHDDPDHSLCKLTGGSKWFRRTEENKS